MVNERKKGKKIFLFKARSIDIKPKVGKKDSKLKLKEVLRSNRKALR
ncbi:hypothetical protein HRbin06_00645 [archaeon HR06]|nr:hypothetical protein HRbin06_00645 [archaeon HR06]